MYALLGDIRFEGFKGFSGFSGSNETVLSEHPVIEGKPRLQMVGEKLEEINLKINFHVSFCNPEKELELLQAYRRIGSILDFVAGDGTDYGKFVIKSIGRDLQQTNNKGSIISVDVDITLIESFTPGQQKKLKPRLAIKEPSLSVPTRAPKFTEPQLIFIEMKNVNTQTAAMNKELADAQRIASKADRAFRLAEGRIKSIQKSLVKMESVGTNARNITGLYQSINGQIQVVKGQTQALSTFVAARDIGSSVQSSSALRNSFSKLNIDATPIADLVATRRDKEKPVNNNGTHFNFIFDGNF